MQLDFVILFRLAFATLYWVYLSYLLLLSQPWVAFETGVWFPTFQPDLSATLPSLGLHFSSYFLGTSITLWALEGLERRWLRVALAIVCVHAFAFEWMQLFVPLRWFSISDLLFNVLGVAVAWRTVPMWLQSDRLPSAA